MNSVVGTSKAYGPITGHWGSQQQIQRTMRTFKIKSANGPVELVVRGARVAQW